MCTYHLLFWKLTGIATLFLCLTSCLTQSALWSFSWLQTKIGSVEQNGQPLLKWYSTARTWPGRILELGHQGTSHDTLRYTNFSLLLFFVYTFMSHSILTSPEHFCAFSSSRFLMIMVGTTVVVQLDGHSCNHYSIYGCSHVLKSKIKIVGVGSICFPARFITVP